MTKILSQSEVAAIRERAAKATPGPWEEGERGIYTMGESFHSGGHSGDQKRGIQSCAFYSRKVCEIHGDAEPLDELDPVFPRANRAFIAASRADVPALCDTVDALRAKLEVAKAELQGIVEYWNGAPESAVDAIETVADRAHNCLARLNTLAAEALGTSGACDARNAGCGDR